ncbi:hypothetical protein ACJRW5_07460 [Pseudomonas sp. SH1-B]
MSSNEARFHLSIRDGVFEITGSEGFVSEQINSFKEAILDTLTRRTVDAPIVGHQPSPPCPQLLLEAPAEEEPASANPSDTYNRVLHMEGDQVRVLKRIPGGTLAKKTVNAALVYLWGKRSLGINEVPMQEIRQLCQEQSCLDASNFAGILKNAKEFILLDGKKGSSSKTCKLTIPGVEEAGKLLAQLNGKSNE